MHRLEVTRVQGDRDPNPNSMRVLDVDPDEEQRDRDRTSSSKRQTARANKFMNSWIQDSGNHEGEQPQAQNRPTLRHQPHKQGRRLHNPDVDSSGSSPETQVAGCDGELQAISRNRRQQWHPCDHGSEQKVARQRTSNTTASAKT